MTATASWSRRMRTASSTSPSTGKPIDETAEFIVVTNNYRASGGGNFPGTKTTVVLEAPDLNRDVIVRYILDEEDDRAQGRRQLGARAAAGGRQRDLRDLAGGSRQAAGRAEGRARRAMAATASPSIACGAERRGERALFFNPPALRAGSPRTPSSCPYVRGHRPNLAGDAASTRFVNGSLRKVRDARM